MSKVHRFQIDGKRKDAVETILGELEGREDVLDSLTPNDVTRALVDYAIREHRAGRGPWPVRR